MALQVCSSFASLVALPLWGKHADLVGNVRVLRLSSFFAALVPAFWLLSQDPAYLMLIQIWEGFRGAGLHSARPILSTTPSRHKSAFVASRTLTSSTAWRFFSALPWEVFLLHGCRRFSAILCSAFSLFPASAGFSSTCCSRALFARSDRPTRLPFTSCSLASSVFVRWSGRAATDWQAAEKPHRLRCAQSSRSNVPTKYASARRSSRASPLSLF